MCRVRLAVFSVVFACAAVVGAAEPLVRNLNIRGLQIEGTTSLAVDGDFLVGAKLLLPFPAQETLKPDSTDKRANIDVVLAGDVLPGLYNLRVVTDGGVSLPLVIGVDKLAQKAMAPLVETLPVAFHGAIGGSSVAETKFAGKAGQAITIEVEASRLDSKLRPVLHLHNARRRQLAWSWPMTSLASDTRLTATLPEDGEYTVSLHDLEYGPPGPGHYRLKIGPWNYVDHIFPPVVSKGEARTIELGSVPPLTINLSPPAAVGFLPLDWPAGQTWSGPRPSIEISSHAEVLEQSPSALQQLPAGLVGVSGRLAAPHEEDRYQVSVVPGQKIKFEVFSERYGSPVDTAIIIRNEKGDPLARGEDSPGSIDPVLEYTAPPQGTTVIVGVADTLGRGSPAGIYRLVVTPPGVIKQELRLTSPVQRAVLANAGRCLVPVYAERVGFAGPIEVAALALPGGVRLEAATIPADRDGTLVTLVREGGAGAAVTTLHGRTPDGQASPVTFTDFQPGRARAPQLARVQPWLEHELPISLTTANAADFQVDWKDLPADAGLIPGRKLTLPVKLVRPADNVNVRLTLVTAQAPVLVNGQIDQNRTLRAEQPQVELAANVNEGQMVVVIPADLTQTAYQVAIQAELLTADKQSVTARAFTPIRDLPLKHQLVLTPNAPRVEVALDAKTGAMLKLEGKIERREGLTGDVQVAITGLPPGVQGNPVTVKADAVDYLLNVVFPANAMPGELKDLRLIADAADPQANNVRVKSRPAPLTIVVQPPPAPQ